MQNEILSTEARKTITNAINAVTGEVAHSKRDNPAGEHVFTEAIAHLGCLSTALMANNQPEMYMAAKLAAALCIRIMVDGDPYFTERDDTSIYTEIAADVTALGADAASLVWEAVCRVCGCSDSRACQGGCTWMELDRKNRTGLCSRCAAAASNGKH
jgi:hypothetical protein